MSIAKSDALRYSRYTLDVLRTLYRLMRTGSKLWASALNTFKEFPIIGWALATLQGGLKIFSLFQEKTPWYKKLWPLAQELVKLTLAVFAMLLPLVVGGATFLMLAPIAAVTLTAIGSYQAIMRAWKAYKKHRDAPTATSKIARNAAMADAVIASLQPIAMGCMFFVPGAALAAGVVALVCMAARLLLHTVELGITDAPKPARAETEEMHTQTDSVPGASPRLLPAWQHAQRRTCPPQVGQQYERRYKRSLSA